MEKDSAISQRDLFLLGFLFLLETSVVAVLTALHVKGERTFDLFLSTRPGLVFLCAAVGCLLAAAGITNIYLAHRHSPSRYFRLIVAMNLVTVLLMLITGEVAVRASSRVYLDGEAFGKVALVPKNWETTRAHYRAILERASGDLSYLVYDDRMGWSVGPNRRSANGLYWSGPEAVRVPHEEVTRAISEAKPTIALIGDSYTFGEEVSYEETWAYHLGGMLRNGVQILNFGVPGYGVDQAYLRYEKDARRWKPKIAIFGLFPQDFLRTMTVYPFIANPRWEMPFSKPRFMVSDGKGEILNDPPLRPDVIFSYDSIFELPFLIFDRGYKESNWRTSFYHSSYLFQLFVSVLPPWSAVTPDLSEDAFVSVNTSILKSFLQTAAQDGTIPVAVYLPGRKELRKQRLPRLVNRVLQDVGMAYVDPTPCLLEVNSADRFMPGGHYAPAGNAAVAKCLEPVVQEALRRVPAG